MVSRRVRVSMSIDRQKRQVKKARPQGRTYSGRRFIGVDALAFALWSCICSVLWKFEILITKIRQESIGIDFEFSISRTRNEPYIPY